MGFGTSLDPEFEGNLLFHRDSKAIERWKSLLPLLRGSGLFRSAEWIELLRVAHSLAFVVAELRKRERVLSGLLTAHPYPRWIFDRVSALPFSDFYPTLEAEHGQRPPSSRSSPEVVAPRVSKCEGLAHFCRGRSPAHSPPGVDCEIFWRGMNRVLGTPFRREVKRGLEEIPGSCPASGRRSRWEQTSAACDRFVGTPLYRFLG